MLGSPRELHYSVRAYSFLAFRFCRLCDDPIGMSKVIVVGNVAGDFSIFRKLRTLHQKQNFDVVIILNLFSDDQTVDLRPLLDGEIEVVFPTYFTLGVFELPPDVRLKLHENNGQLCPNLWFTGKRSVIKTTEGIRIVALGGIPDPKISSARSSDEFSHLYSEGDVKSLYGAKTADLLLTSQWPADVRNGSSVHLPADASISPGDAAISRLCVTLKPRYHFSSSDGFFYEREPFTFPPENSESQLPRFTRFISLAQYGNKSKEKWLYAFSINTKEMPLELPASTTPSPFMTLTGKRQRPDAESGTGNGFSRYGDSAYSDRRSKKHKGKGPPGPESCFFCLSNPNLATHMITSIGDEAYLATAKGPLTTKKTFSSLSFPGHLLIMPLAHEPTLANIPSLASRKSTYAEMTRYRLSLQKMVAQTCDGGLGSITWGISRKEGVHMHWQFLPIRAELVEKGLIEAAFQVEAENERLGNFETQTTPDDIDKPDSFIRVWIWCPESGDDKEKGLTGGKVTTLTMNLVEGARFDLQFPRKVVAKLLGLEQRIQWRECQQSEAEEVADANAFKTAFKSFDPAE